MRHYNIAYRTYQMHEGCRKMYPKLITLVSTIAELNLKKLLDDFDAVYDKYPVYRWARMYMREVTTMLSFLQATRQQHWDLHLASLEVVYLVLCI